MDHRVNFQLFAAHEDVKVNCLKEFAFMLLASFLCSVLRFSLSALSGFSWLFFFLHEMAFVIHSGMSQIRVSEMGMSLLNFFFSRYSLTEKRTQKKFLRATFFIHSDGCWDGLNTTHRSIFHSACIASQMDSNVLAPDKQIATRREASDESKLLPGELFIAVVGFSIYV